MPGSSRNWLAEAGRHVLPSRRKSSSATARAGIWASTHFGGPGPSGDGADHGRHLLQSPPGRAGNRRFQAGPLNLEDHLAAAAQAGSVHWARLAEPSGCCLKDQRFGATFSPAPAQQGFNDAEGEGRTLSCQAGELGPQ